MKKHLAVLCLTAVLAAALLLAGCGKKPEAAGAAAGTPPPAATPSPAPLPLRGLQPYNSRAWYVEKIDMEQDKWVLHRYDFASAAVSVLPLPRANEYPVVLADGQDLYAFYMGGAMAGPPSTAATPIPPHGTACSRCPKEITLTRRTRSPPMARPSISAIVPSLPTHTPLTRSRLCALISPPAS